MYNYNLINPINITYRNPKQDPAYKKAGGEETDAQKTPVSLDENKNQRHFPNGNKVQIDYTKNTVNIAQVVEDFKSTIAAINAPKEIADEVHSYLNLVEMESKKENPSREIILANLKNASKISDKFIEDSLKKPSTVVEDWVNALFLQHVELKSNPNFVNEAFRVQIPDNKKDAVTGGAAPVQSVPQDAYNQNFSVQKPTEPVFDTVSKASDFQNSAVNIYDIPQNRVTLNEIKPIGQMTPEFYAQTQATSTFSVVQNAQNPDNVPNIGVQNVQNPDVVQNLDVNNAQNTLNKSVLPQNKLTYSTTAPIDGVNLPENGAVSFGQANEKVYKLNATSSEDIQTAQKASTSGVGAVKSNMARAKRIVKENNDPYSALKLYDEALRLVQKTGDENLKAAIHFERGKVFDDYDYADLALRDYNNATKCSDYNLKTHAHIKMGRIYDDYVMFDPAVEQYSLAVETSEEAKNPNGKTKALRYLAALFADRYDRENTANFNTLSIDAAYETGNSKTIARTLMDAASNFEYVGDDAKALSTYKEAAKVLYSMKDYSTLSKNYEAASEIMERLGNGAKAMNLLSKALQYRQKAELQTGGQVIPA